MGTSAEPHRSDLATTRIGECYADQNERDYELFVKAIDSGRLEAQTGL